MQACPKVKTFGRLEDESKRHRPVGFSMTDVLLARIDEAAAQRQISRSAFLREAVERQLETCNPQPTHVAA